MEKVAGNMIKSVTTGELCRAWAHELSTIKPQLDAQGVGLIAVGLEELGLKDFVDGGFFKGDLFLDQELATYKALGMERASALSIPGLLISKDTRSAAARANALGIKGDMKGNGLQKGGTYVVEKGGKVLLSYTQKGFGDHPELKDILSSLGIAGEQNGTATSSNQPKCNDNVCSK